MSKLPVIDDPNVLVGHAGSDDAGVYRLSDDLVRDIADAVARLSAKWARERPTNGAHRTAENGQILQTLEKGRAHMVTVQVKRSRRDPR